MLSVIIPTLNAEATLPRVLSALIPAAVHGLVREVIIVDGGSEDSTANIVEASGAKFIKAPRGRGSQMQAGAKAAKSSWLLFLHADTILEQGWDTEVEKFFEHVAAERFPSPEMAGAFRFTLDDFSGAARFLERIVALRCALFKLPYGDQGLLVNRRLFDKLGGFRPIPLMEDVDLVRRIGRKRLVMFRSQAVTSSQRYLKRGYVARIIRNAFCLTLYYLHVPPSFIARLYA
ncbi:MAG: TIGR04283 family arsenosugar biosynthesis glycosyltransferase [Parvibaculaceae bacterium]